MREAGGRSRHESIVFAFKITVMPEVRIFLKPQRCKMTQSRVKLCVPCTGQNIHIDFIRTDIVVLRSTNALAPGAIHVNLEFLGICCGGPVKVCVAGTGGVHALFSELEGLVHVLNAEEWWCNSW